MLPDWIRRLMGGRETREFTRERKRRQASRRRKSRRRREIVKAQHKRARKAGRDTAGNRR